jgi:hypothetical protein
MLDTNSAAVQSHLSMLQGIVNRLAANSASCKTWCITITSALAVVTAESGKVEILGVASLPILLFGALDGYYLGLERRFRRCYEVFVKKLHDGTANVEDAFLIAPRLPIRGLSIEALEALVSFSIWPFYVGLAGLLWVLGSRLVGGG